MPILHKNITAETDIHNPKWFSNANNGDYAWKNEQGNLESIDELLLPAALNFVDASVAPPTSNAGDIYVLSSGGSVNAGWGSVSLQDWVRYDGTAWNSITPQKSSLCYNENSDTLLSFNGTAWAAIGGGIDNVTSAEKAALSPNTGDFVYDTDLNSLQRYNGSSWVDLAKGYGIVSVNDSSGIPTFYASLSSAYAAASSGDVVKLHADISESGAVTITIVNGVTLDLNGYTYTHTGNADVFSRNAGIITTVHTIKNGKVLKSAGTGYVYYETYSTAKTNLINVDFENTGGECLKISGDADLFGSTFKHNSASTSIPFVTANKIIRGGLFINSGAGDTWSTSDLLDSEWRNTSSGTAITLNGSDGTNIKGIANSNKGINAVASKLLNSQGISTSGIGINSSGSTTIIEHCYGESGSNIGLLANGISRLIHSTGISKGSSYGIYTTATLTSHCYSETQSGSYSMFTGKHDITIQFCALKVNSGTGSGSFNNGFRNRFYNNVIEVANSSAYGLISNAADGYFAGNLVKGTTTAVKFTTGSNQWTATLDGQGNSAQL